MICLFLAFLQFDINTVVVVIVVVIFVVVIIFVIVVVVIVVVVLIIIDVVVGVSRTSFLYIDENTTFEDLRGLRRTMRYDAYDTCDTSNAILCSHLPKNINFYQGDGRRG